MFGASLELVNRLGEVVSYVWVLVPGGCSYGKITLLRLPVSGLQSMIISYTNTSRSIFLFMVIPICFISQDLAYRCFQLVLI